MAVVFREFLKRLLSGAEKPVFRIVNVSPSANPPCFSGWGIWQPAMQQQFADPTVGLSRHAGQDVTPIIPFRWISSIGC